MAKFDTDNDGRREGLDGGRLTPQRAMAVRRPRNSSGSNSALASVLELRIQLTLAWEVIEALVSKQDDPELIAQVGDIRRRLLSRRL